MPRKIRARAEAEQERLLEEAERVNLSTRQRWLNRRMGFPARHRYAFRLSEEELAKKEEKIRRYGRGERNDEDKKQARADWRFLAECLLGKEEVAEILEEEQ